MTLFQTNIFENVTAMYCTYVIEFLAYVSEDFYRSLFKECVGCQNIFEDNRFKLFNKNVTGVLLIHCFTLDFSSVSCVRFQTYTRYNNLCISQRVALRRNQTEPKRYTLRGSQLLNHRINRVVNWNVLTYKSILSIPRLFTGTLKPSKVTIQSWNIYWHYDVTFDINKT